MVFCSEVFSCASSFKAFPAFSSTQFAVSGFMLTSLAYLELSFVQADKSVRVLLHAIIQFDQADHPKLIGVGSAHYVWVA